jgi:hypothetical protein
MFETPVIAPLRKSSTTRKSSKISSIVGLKRPRASKYHWWSARQPARSFSPSRIAMSSSPRRTHNDRHLSMTSAGIAVPFQRDVR